MINVVSDDTWYFFLRNLKNRIFSSFYRKTLQMLKCSFCFCFMPTEFKLKVKKLSVNLSICNLLQENAAHAEINPYIYRVFKAFPIFIHTKSKLRK